MGIAHCKKCNHLILPDYKVCKHCGVKNPLAFKYRLYNWIATFSLFLFILIIAPFAIVWAIFSESCIWYKKYIKMVNKLKRIKRIKRFRELRLCESYRHK